MTIFRKYFLRHVFKNILIILFGVCVLLTIDYIQLLLPGYVGKIVETFRNSAKLESSKLYSEISRLLVLIIIFASSVFFGRMIWRFAIFGASRNIDNAIRKDLFNHATKMSQNFYQKNKVGAIMSYFIADVEAVRNIYGRGVMQLVDGTALLGIALYKMAMLDKFLTVLALLPSFLVIMVMFMLRQEMQKRFIKKQKAFEMMNDFTQESISGLSIIRAYVRESFERLRFKKSTENYFENAYNYAKVQKKYFIYDYALISLAYVFIIAYGAYIVVFSGFNPGELVAFLALYGTMLWPLNAIVEFVQTFTQANGSSKRLAKFLDTEVEIKDGNDILNLDEISGSIKFNNLSFKYPDDDKYVLKNVSFEIKDGEKVGILGKTGSGKSTIVELLLRLYNVDKDKIIIGGQDVLNLPIKFVRDNIGYVPQDNFLFSDTIKNNIAFYNNNIDNEKIILASKQSAIYQNIMNFTNKFDTVIGERGVMISGGQKQRISISRAIIKDPNILILDDSVSAVDVETEKEILDTLSKIRENKTTILIAHRISTIKNMDKIIFIDGGKVIDIGSHNDLIKKNKEYRDYVLLQSLEKL